MSDLFQYIAENGENGIIKLHAIKSVWDQSPPAPPSLGGSGGSMAARARELASLYMEVQNAVSTLIGNTITFLEKVDENFKLEDTSQADALIQAGAGLSLSEIVAAAEEAGTPLDTFLEELSENYGLGEALAGAGYIGTIYDFIQDIRNGKTVEDFAKVGVDVYQFLQGARTTLSNYLRIGRAVGTKTAMTWWAKSVTGIKPLGRASSAKNVVTRFKNNLTNKTSPFNVQFKGIIDDFKGANGAGKAVASWAGVALNGVLNYSSNREEQAASGGEMSDGRVIAETVTETVVDTAINYGASIAVGAAVTAVAGTVAAPGVVVVAATGLVVAGVNAGVKALTGKTTTEWVSDAILDAGEAIGKAAEKAKNAVAGWFSKLKFF